MAVDLSIPEPYKWNATFDIGNDLINQQHVGLFDGIAALDAARDSKDAFDSLVALVLAHFKTEEELFAKFEYDSAVAHKSVHDKFVADVSAVKSVGDAEIAFLKEWLVKHIKVSDIKYKDCLSGKTL
jgi:hemerythrin